MFNSCSTHHPPPPLCPVGVDEAEPGSDSRGDRLDFFVKQEEAGDGGFIGSTLASEREEAGGRGPERGGSVANLRAALMSKNSLLSLGADILSEDNPLLFDYLPKGGHSLSRKSQPLALLYATPFC